MQFVGVHASSFISGASSEFVSLASVFNVKRSVKPPFRSDIEAWGEPIARKKAVQGYALDRATAYGCVAYGGGIESELPSDPRPITHRRGANTNTASC
jgi:hypothetical protein